MTTASLLRETYGPRRRLVCAIDGLQELIWQDDGTGVPPTRNARGTPDVTDLLALEPPADELSWGIDVGEMDVKPSAMTIGFRNVDDPADSTSKYFAKLFAPGLKSSSAQKSCHLDRTASTNPYVLATATTINIKGDNSSWSATGYAYTARETFSYTGRTGSTFTGASRGRWSCTDLSGATSWTPTYKVPDYSNSTAGPLGIEISTVPYTWIGRRIALHVVAYDDSLPGWRTNPIDASLLWIGRINSIRYNGNRGVWELGCEHILADLEEKIAVGMPRARLYGINMRGPQGTTFGVSVLKSDGTADDSGDLKVPSGVYKNHQALAAAMTKLMGPVHCTLHFDGSTYCLDAWNYTGGDDVCFWIIPYTTAANPNDEDPDYQCHAWRALGFDIDSQTCIGPLGSGDHGYLSASRPPAEAYHPLGRAVNGWKCHCTVTDATDTASLWDGTQSDYGATMATAEIKSAVFDEEEKHAFRFRYNAKSMVTYVDGTGSVGTLVIIPDQALDLPYKYLHNSYVAQWLGDEQAEVRNVHVPAYYTSGGRARGPFELLLHMLCSTGTTGYNDTYDTLPPELSAGMQQALVDITTFLDADMDIAGNALAQRRDYVIGDGISWLDLLKRECKLFGYVLAWDSSQGKLALRSIYSHNIDTYTETLTDSNGVDPSEFPDCDMSDATVINRWELSILYNRLTDKYLAPITVEDEDSIQQLRTAKTVSVKHPGVWLGGGTIEAVEGIVGDLFRENRYCWRYPWQVVTKTLAPYLINRISIGDVVWFRSSRIPDPYGGGTMVTDCAAFVTNLTWNLSDWTGKATLLLYSAYSADQVTPWAWSALTPAGYDQGESTISMWDPATYQLTLTAKTWGETADSDDAAEATTGDVVDIIERAPADPTAEQKWVARVVASAYETDGANILTLQATTLTGWDPYAEYVIVPSIYSSVVASQKAENAFQGDASTQLLGSDPPHRYG